MNVFVSGLWHLGSVTAACIARFHQTVAFDPVPSVVSDLQKGIAPLFEPGLNELLTERISAGALHFTSSPSAVAVADVIWITYDTPVDQHDKADTGYVFDQVCNLFEYIRDDALVLISSQAPCGFVASLEREFAARRPGATVDFACSPENLRLGQALEVFNRPDRIIVGCRTDRAKTTLEQLLCPLEAPIVWMTPESAEMTKHAINGFLAVSVTFMNEIAAICERVGADAKSVEAGLRSESRIGPKAYVGPGMGFAGGTLARDINFLSEIGHREGTPVDVCSAVFVSNDKHKNWVSRQIQRLIGSPAGITVCILGLTYKPGTDTLRRSTAIEIAEDLFVRGAHVRAFDPVVRSLPAQLSSKIELCETIDKALDGVDVAIVGTEWPEFRGLTGSALSTTMRRPFVLDPKRFLEEELGAHDGLVYVGVGRPASLL